MKHRPRRRPGTSARMLLGAALTLAAGQSNAAQCNISTQSVSFGVYNVFDTAHLDGAGNVVITCDATTAYAVSLSPGNGSYASRAMHNGIHTLSYNLFSDPARAVVWGDGTGGSATVSGAFPGTGQHPVYGRIYARQNAYPGYYSDTITVTVNF